MPRSLPRPLRAVSAFDATRGVESLQTVLYRQPPGRRAGFQLERTETSGRSVSYTTQRTRPASRRAAVLERRAVPARDRLVSENQATQQHDADTLVDLDAGVPLVTSYRRCWTSSTASSSV